MASALEHNFSLKRLNMDIASCSHPDAQRIKFHLHRINKIEMSSLLHDGVLMSVVPHAMQAMSKLEYGLDLLFFMLRNKLELVERWWLQGVA